MRFDDGLAVLLLCNGSLLVAAMVLVWMEYRQ